MAKDTRIKIQLPSSFTDGSPAYWPKAPFMKKSDDLYYHEKVADMWMKHIGESVPGKKYIFDRLPRGYTIFAKARINDKNHVDRYLFGHPKKAFRSPNEFIDHFKWLMVNGVGCCTCIYCSESKKTRGPGPGPPSARQTSTSREPTKHKRKVPRGKNGDFASIIELYFASADEQPRDDVKIAFGDKYTRDKLQAGRTFEEIAEGYLKVPSFLPRVGELVLFYINGSQLARFEAETQRFMLFDHTSKKLSSFPDWKAGVISREPQQTPDVKDLRVALNEQIPKDRNHYLIDLFPDPDGEDKSLSGHIYHVSVDHIRPLSMYHETLSGIPQENWDKTIYNALKVASSVAVVDPIILRREGAKAIVECRGVWVGPELWVRGDAVRMKPHNGIPVHGALIIDGIDFVVESTEILKASVYIWGRAFSVSKDQALKNKKGNKLLELKQVENRLSCFDGYKWYPMCQPDGEEAEYNMADITEEPCESFLGRLYESKAMEALVGSTHFDVAQEGLHQVRAWALNNRQYDQWIANQKWSIMNDRLEMLDIDTLYGHHVPAKSSFGKNERSILNSKALLPSNYSEDLGLSDDRTSSIFSHSHNDDESTDSFKSAIIAGKVMPSEDDDDVEILEVRTRQVGKGSNTGGHIKKNRGQSSERVKGTRFGTNGTHVSNRQDGKRGLKKQQGIDDYEDDGEVRDKYSPILVKRVRID